MIIKFFLSIFSIDKQAAELEESNDHEGNSDSGYSGSQQSVDNSVALEMEGDSTSLSQTSSEELPEASEKNRFTFNPLLEKLKGKLLPCESQNNQYYWHTENLCTCSIHVSIIFLVNSQQINKGKAVIVATAVVNSLSRNPVRTVLCLKWKMTL